MFKKTTLISAAAAVLALAAIGPASGATADPTVGVKPAKFTPWLPASAPGQYIQQIVQCGGTMYAAGKINTVEQGTTTYSRAGGFSFAAATGAMTTWNPQVVGEVNSIALSPDCSTAYLGGVFTSAGGATAKNIVAVSTSTGKQVSTFAHSADATVETLQYTHGKVLVGGSFTSINKTPRTAFASLDPTTGAVTGYANLAISGGYPESPTSKFYNSQINHTGTKMLVEGVFTSIAGQPRQQVAMLDLGTGSITVDGWYPTEFNQHCSANKYFYGKGANWSPDDSTVYVVTTGWKPVSGPGSSMVGPRAGLCDAAMSFPATSGPVLHTWINYTGCDSLFAVAADNSNVYIGGHERYIDNGLTCDALGPGASSRPGIGDIDPSSGMSTTWNPTRSRGHGVNDLLLTTAGLWITSDNGATEGASQACGHYPNHGGLCFLPYS